MPLASAVRSASSLSFARSAWIASRSAIRVTSTPLGQRQLGHLEVRGVRVLQDPQRVVGLAEEPGELARRAERAVGDHRRQRHERGHLRVGAAEVIDDRAGVREVGRGGVRGDDVDERFAAGERVVRPGVVARPVVPDAPHHGCTGRDRSASFGRCSVTSRPGVLVGIVLNSPRISAGASGFGSNVSMWLGPPNWNSMMTLLAVALLGLPCAIFSGAARWAPAALRPATTAPDLRRCQPYGPVRHPTIADPVYLGEVDAPFIVTGDSRTHRTSACRTSR